MLLELLELTGAVVTLDAMHCQTETAQAIRNAEADYVLSVKKNQATLYNKLVELFTRYGEMDYKVPGLRRHVSVEKSHGREERRVYYAIATPADPILDRWAGVCSIGMIYRHRENGQSECDEAMFFISSFPPKVRRLSRLIRDHWLIRDS